ncbi:MAG TPA: tetratricopeptide repeat protein [Candidatus Binatia bacterium]|jgi:tetratricopeptide (TPR) repeat protein|nr:tetratricopeptide repeat protein [Candidatus Binatia bacterium]
MNILPLLLIALLLAFPLTATAQTPDELIKSATITPDKATQARLYKQAGDKLIAQDRMDQAADAFSKALAAARESFSSAERVQMAIYLSWADRLAESKEELTRVLAREPKNIAARTHLARVLSWSGELREAIVQADMVLKESPDHKEALVVKADSLQWQGRYVDAMPIYRRIIVRDGDFDARAGLSRSLLAVGNRTEALENRNALKPGNGRQERELAKLSEAIDQETRPTLAARYNYYHDSDQNRLNRYSLAGNFWVDNQKFGINFRHTDANDPTRDNRAEDLLFKIYSRLTDQFGAGAGIGFTQLADRHTSDFLAGHIRFDGKLFAGTAGVNVTREVLSDTAELIENRIRMTNVGLYVSQPLTERFSVYGGYNYKSFSDGNHANDLQLTTQYAIYLAPKIMIGHRFRLLDFHEQSGSGFFDPNNYIANRAFASVYYENRLLYTYLEGYVGYQTFRRNQVATDSFIHGGAGSVGIKPIANLAIEVNVEGGNFAAGSTAGFNYFIVGPRVLYRF